MNHLQNGNTSRQCMPIGMKLLAAFFTFGAAACAVTVAALLAPGGVLDLVWRLNPDAEGGFREIGSLWSVLLMLMVGTACACAAVGLAKHRLWGRRLAMAILAVNLVGDSLNAAMRHDPRTLIGLPVGGAMMAYLWKNKNPAGKAENRRSAAGG